MTVLLWVLIHILKSLDFLIELVNMHISSIGCDRRWYAYPPNVLSPLLLYYIIFLRWLTPPLCKIT